MTCSRRLNEMSHLLHTLEFVAATGVQTTVSADTLIMWRGLPMANTVQALTLISWLCEANSTWQFWACLFIRRPTALNQPVRCSVLLTACKAAHSRCLCQSCTYILYSHFYRLDLRSRWCYRKWFKLKVKNCGGARFLSGTLKVKDCMCSTCSAGTIYRR